jgi:hypothetical protein
MYETAAESAAIEMKTRTRYAHPSLILCLSSLACACSMLPVDTPNGVLELRLDFPKGLRGLLVLISVSNYRSTLWRHD